MVLSGKRLEIRGVDPAESLPDQTLAVSGFEQVERRRTQPLAHQSPFDGLRRHRLQEGGRCVRARCSDTPSAAVQAGRVIQPNESTWSTANRKTNPEAM